MLLVSSREDFGLQMGRKAVGNHTHESGKVSSVTGGEGRYWTYWLVSATEAEVASGCQIQLHVLPFPLSRCPLGLVCLSLYAAV